MDWIRFELIIMDMLADEGFSEEREIDPEEIRVFSDEIHQHVELAVEDYCRDIGVEDYVPVY